MVGIRFHKISIFILGIKSLKNKFFQEYFVKTQAKNFTSKSFSSHNALFGK